MDLHRAGKRPQWEDTKPEDRNWWQRLAARTHSVVTPGNAISLVGAGLTARGLYNVSRGKHSAAVLQLFLGGLCDLGDGAVASKTKTKSPLGEAVDATIDKAAIGGTIAVLVASGAMPLASAVAIAGQNVANAGFSVIAKSREHELHASREGKITTAVQRMALASYALAALADMADRPELAKPFKRTGHVLTVAATATGVITTIGYAVEALASEAQTADSEPLITVV